MGPGGTEHLRHPALATVHVNFVTQGYYQTAGCLGRAKGKSHLSDIECFLKFVFVERGGG